MATTSSADAAVSPAAAITSELCAGIPFAALRGDALAPASTLLSAVASPLLAFLTTRDAACLRAVCTEAYASYQRMLEAGVAREVARMVLPVTIYSSMYVTMNARSLMNFLSLRTMREGTHFPSFPQREIEMVAEKMEQFWVDLMPMTSASFNANGRVAP